MKRYDVIVAGLGAMGSAALDHLSRRGVGVLGIEPHGIPHRHGSSGGDTRLIRKAYFEHPDYVPLLERAYQHWRTLESDTGEALLHAVGTVYLGRPDAELIAGSRRSAQAHGLTLEELGAAQLTRDYPHLRCPEGHVALLEPEAGFVLCERAVRAQVARALDHGAALVTGERLLDWHAGDDGVLVTTNRERYAAGALVITVGGWSRALLGGLEVPLRVTRQPLFWIQPERPAAFALGRSPCWALQRAGSPGLFYGFPGLPGSLAPQLGVKIGHHYPGEEVDPDDRRRAATHAELDEVLAAVSSFLPDLQGPMTGSHVCLYTNTVDGHFVIDRHPDHGNVVVGCGFSGHGFKFAPVVGEALADLVLDGASTLPIGFLGLDRFTLK